MNIPAVPLLRKWIEDRGLTPHRWAIENRLDSSELHKVLAGKRGRVSVEFAARIEDATGGDIWMRLWVPVRETAA